MKQRADVRISSIFVATLCALHLCAVFAGPSEQDSAPLTIEASYNRQSFSPDRGESVSIRYNVSKPATISLSIVGPDGREWYRDTQTASSAGNGEFIWAGVSNKKITVPAEAYRYQLTAKQAKETVIAGSAGFVGGNTMDATQITLNATDKTISYLLRQPARVRVMARLAQGSVPLGTIIDWQARPAGLHSEAINLEHFRELFGEQQIIPIVQAWALPPDTIIVLPKTGMPDREHFFTSKDKPAGEMKSWFANSTDTSTMQHASHIYDRCFDPAVTITPLGTLQNQNGKWLINQMSTFSFTAAADQGAGRVAPIPRLSLFVFVDDVMVTRLMPAYFPYQWKLDPAKYLAGDHVVTLMLSWRDDHIGVTHQKIYIPPAVAKQQKD